VTVYIRLFTSKQSKLASCDWKIPIYGNTEIKVRGNLFNSREVVLGISSYFHDSSCTIIVNGKIEFAAQEERFTREKNTSAFPHQSIKLGLKTLGLDLNDITTICYFENPQLKFKRIREQIRSISFIAAYKMVKTIFWRLWKFHIRFNSTLKKDLHLCGFSNKFLKSNPIIFSNHHLSHALSAFVPSPFLNANIIVIDAVGEYATTSIWKANNNHITLLRSINFPNSIGMLYSAITYFCGFKVNSGEYKLMGLAPFGKPTYVKLILSNLIEIYSDSSFKINSSFLTYFSGTKIINELRLEKLFGFPRRLPESEIAQEYMDLAASMQEVLNQYVEKLCRYSLELNKSENLCLAGGVALNCVTNGHIDRTSIFQNIWIQPAAGDAGTSLGAAILVATNDYTHKDLGQESDAMQGAFLGTGYSNSEIEEVLQNHSFVYEKLSSEELLERATECIQRNNIVGWFQGRMEFGPRSLGARSIIANPTDPNGQSRINLKIKFRESFRPFAPAMLQNSAEKYFESIRADKYMLFVSFFRPEFRYKVISEGKLNDVSLIRSAFPSVTHVDYSARVQVVDNESPIFDLLLNLEKRDIPMVVNTSFNVRGEPIVESPKNALYCFMATDIDDLFLGNFYITKSKQTLDRNLFVNSFDKD